MGHWRKQQDSERWWRLRRLAEKRRRKLTPNLASGKGTAVMYDNTIILINIEPRSYKVFNS